MLFTLFGTPVSSGIAIGRALVLASSSHKVDHYYIPHEQVNKELKRLESARDTVLHELQTLQQQLPKSSSAEISSILEVHIMILSDSSLQDDLLRWVTERFYNAEWALDSQLKVLLKQFNEMKDEYLRERGADFEQIVNRMQNTLAVQRDRTTSNPISTNLPAQSTHPLIIVANDITPADMLHFKENVFSGFVTDIGGPTSHSAIVARSLNVPALVGARNASQLIKQDDLLIIDSEYGTVIVNPSPQILEEYHQRQLEFNLQQEHLNGIRHASAETLDGQSIELLANIETPADATKALDAGAQGIGLFRSEFLFMSFTGNKRRLPDEEEQYLTYKAALEAMPEQPVTIRTIDIGADKPLYDDSVTTLNPALGLRAIRWSLTEPDIFITQIRALFRAAHHGNLYILIPLLSHEWQIERTFALIDQAKKSLQQEGVTIGDALIGAMIEVPAAALTLPLFLHYFDFLSVGTNDLIQYTLAVDRADESVSNLFDHQHPAVLKLIANTIKASNEVGKKICVCGEMAGDTTVTRLLLGLGLRSFSMPTSKILAVKNMLLQCNIQKIAPLAQAVINSKNRKEQEAALLALQKA